MWEQGELAGEDYSAWWKATSCIQDSASCSLILHLCIFRPRVTQAAGHAAEALGQFPAGTDGGAGGGGGAGGRDSVRPWAATCRGYRRCREGTSKASAGCRAVPKVRNHMMAALLCFALLCHGLFSRGRRRELKDLPLRPVAGEVLKNSSVFGLWDNLGRNGQWAKPMR